MSLRVWLPLNGDLRNLGCSGDIQVTNNGATVDNNGKIGKSYYFNSSSRQYIKIPYTLANATEFSICLWYKPITTSITGCLIYFGHTGDYWQFATYQNKIGIRDSSTGLTGARKEYSLGDFTANQWVHLTFTYKTGTLKIYKNGILFSTNNTGGTTMNNYTNVGSGIGESVTNSSNYYVGGNVNDFRIYDHALSAAEVVEIARGLVLHYKLDGLMSGSGINLFKNTNFWCTATSSQAATISQTPSYTSNLQNLVGKTITFSFELYTPGERQNGSGNLGNRFGAHLSLNYTPNGGSATQSYPCASHLVDTISTEHYRVYSTATIPNNCTINSFSMAIQPYARPANGNTATWKIGQFKVEFGDKPTFYSPSPQDLGIDTSIIQDSSGYGHNGEIINTSTFSTDTPRYNSCYHISATNQHIKISGLTTSGFGNSYSFAWWAKISSFSPMHWGFADGIRLNGLYTGRLWNTGDGSNNPLYNPGTTTQVNTPTANVWHHWVMTGDGTKCRVYQDGELWGEAKTYKSINGTTIYINGWANTTDYCSNNLSISDFRIYCTPLLDTDIKSLYNLGMKIDNLSTLHTYELEETNTDKLIKTGVLKSQGLYENGYVNILHYDKNIYIEPDGSTWVHICHHNNPANGVFASNGSWATGYYIDANRWYDVEQILPNLIEYEFMVKQKTTSSAAETKYRWIQSINPMNATWTDVKPGTITYITTSGYTNGNMGGMYYRNDKTYQRMCIANGSNGNWFGGIGVWTAYQGGIPGYPSTTVTSGYVDLYARVYVPTKLIKDKGFSSIQFIEA